MSDIGYEHLQCRQRNLNHGFDGSQEECQFDDVALIWQWVPQVRQEMSCGQGAGVATVTRDAMNKAPATAFEARDE
jgi:hypothetical protein